MEAEELAEFATEDLRRNPSSADNIIFNDGNCNYHAKFFEEFVLQGDGLNN